MGAPVISVRGVGKRYQVFDSPWARLRHAIASSHGGMREIQALHDVSFEVTRGESLGVIGRNGGGKSTLLEILTGTVVPTAGEVAVNGRVSALLELGSGFNPEYTGRENVMLNGLLAGFERREILRRFGEVEAFAEIGEAIDRPVKTYSSGMMMRLAFAVQVLSDPDILVIDEALSVGDFFFQQKCFARIRELRARGVTLVFVSHDMGTVRDLCERAVYLKAGRVQFIGDSRDAIRHYLGERGDGGAAPMVGSAASTQAAEPGELDALIRDRAWTSPHGVGVTDAGRIVAVAFYNERGEPTTTFRLGETLRIKVAYRPDARRPTHVTAVLRNKYDHVVTSIGSSRLGVAPPEPGGAMAIFDMRLELRVEAGNYSVTIGLADWISPNRGESLDTSEAIGPITVQWDYENEVAPFLGMFGPPATASFRTVKP
jgi:lipopolysaccharide transport system ATP-binding protein